MQVGPAGSGALEGAVTHVRSFGPIQRAEVALRGGAVIEIDAPRDRELKAAKSSACSPAATGFSPSKAFSSEVGTGSRKENASKQEA